MRFLKLIHSKGSFPIDHDELPIIEKCIATGTIGKLKAGYFNPSYFVAIEEDKERKAKYLDDIRYQPELKNTSKYLKLENLFNNNGVKQISAPKINIKKLRELNSRRD